ncbi:MAG: CotH kinase family protein, partial [Bacteroidales bacterium]|nr:CotH kinase family protein [Bacteroidales bacterium]
DWYRFDSPSPGMPNSGNVFVKANDPVFSLQAGFYATEQVLEITADDTLAEIRYTTNGDEPTASSSIYSEPILIESRVGEANVYSGIRTNRDPYHWLPDWVPPAGEVFKASVVRAQTFREGFHPSDIITSSYFVDGEIAGRYSTIPVISINSDPRHLFDSQTGIYVPGVNHQTGQSGTGNYFMEWEKPAHIEFFEPGGELGFAQDVGISIQGGTSPASPQKGLHVIARGEYGKNRIRYPLFENDPSSAKELTEFKRFIIRAWGSLITGSLINDAYAHRIMAANDLDIQAYRPVVLFINGEYWGLHALREANKNSWYYQYHHGVDRDDPGCDILLHSTRFGIPHAYIDEGDAKHWNAMMNYINTHDMTEKGNYEYLRTQMDMENFIAYMGHCIYLGKWDWPNNNDASWRPRTIDGRWRWIQYDMETGFGVATELGPQYSMLGPQLNMFEAAIEGMEMYGFGTYGPHPILTQLYVNEDFMEAFTDWFVVRFEHEFHPDTMNQLLDDMSAEIRPYMQEYQHRWPFIGNLRGDWESSLQGIREFNIERQGFVKAQLFELNSKEEIYAVNYRLLQNYPNPFISTTRIEYIL